MCVLLNEEPSITYAGNGYVRTNCSGLFNRKKLPLFFSSLFWFARRYLVVLERNNEGCLLRINRYLV